MMAVGGIRAEQMDPADVAWLHMDRPTNLMVVNTVLWFDVPVDQASVLKLFQERVVSRFRRFRQRAADPALALAPWAAPEWVDDAGFALADHVSRTRLPAPGDQRALQQAASDLAGRPLRKDRPLWELHLLDGYGDGGALLLRTHHAIADGGALVQVLLSLADPLDAGEHPGVLPVRDDTAGPPLLPGPGGRTAGRAVAAARRAGSAAGDLSAVLRAALADPRRAAELAGSARADAAMLRKLGFGLTAGRNRLQGPLVPGKQRAWTRPVPVEAVNTAGAVTGSTVNDLMLTAITSALRRYLLQHDALAEEVIVIVPVDLRPAGAPLPAGLGNEFGLVFVRLPTGETDQGRRRARVKAQMDQVKSSREGVFVSTMLQWMGQLPAAVQNACEHRIPHRQDGVIQPVHEHRGGRAELGGSGQDAREHAVDDHGVSRLAGQHRHQVICQAHVQPRAGHQQVLALRRRGWRPGPLRTGRVAGEGMACCLDSRPLGGLAQEDGAVTAPAKLPPDGQRRRHVAAAVPGDERDP